MFAGSACSDPATARWTRKVGTVLRGRQGLLGQISTTRVLRTFLSIDSAMCFPVWLLLTARMIPLAFVAVEWA